MEKQLRLRDVLIVLLLAVSYGLFFFATTPRYSEIVSPPNPKIEYYKNLANLYLTSTEWETIHLLEDVIVLENLDDGLRQSVIAQNWKNYLRAPSHYSTSYTTSYIKGKLFSDLQDHKADFFSIVINRKSNLNDGSMQTRRLEMLEALELINKDSERLLLLLSQDSKLLEADNLASLISINNSLYYNIDVNEFCEDFTIDDDRVYCESGEIGSATEKLDSSISNFEAVANYPIPLSVTYYFPHYSPKYNEIIYLSYKNLDILDFGDSLVDMSFEFISDPNEDLYLRLLAMQKLSNFSYYNENREIRTEYTDDLYKLLEDYKKTGVLIDGAEFSNQEQSLFKIYILNHLASTIKAEKTYQILEAQENSK
jgi:hypothetical protein